MMSDVRVPNLDDISKTAFCIPYNPSGTEEPKNLIPKSYNADDDLDDGRELRFIAYKDAWTKCLGRMQQIVHDLQAATVREVVQEIRCSYIKSLPGLPYAELPVITLTNSGMGSAVLHDIVSMLVNDPSSDVEAPNCFVAQLYPGDVSNVLSGMRAIITNITDREVDTVKRKAATSLATYDISYLVAWYRAWLDDHETPSNPNIVIVLHEFEQFEPLIMQDILDICSTCIPELPLIFLLSMTSPLPNYLNLTYPRATLSLLRVKQFTSPSGISILETIVFKTFFDADFETDVMIGPAIFKYLHDYFTRYNPSVDTITTVLQLAHLKHFSTNPATVVVKDTEQIAKLPGQEQSLFVEFLVQRIEHGSKRALGTATDKHAAIIGYIDDARQTFTYQLNNIKFGLNILLLLQDLLEGFGYNGVKFSLDSGRRSKIWEAMTSTLEGQSGRVVKDFAMIVRKLKRQEILLVLECVYKYLNDLPLDLSSSGEVQIAKSNIVQMRLIVPKEDKTVAVADAANALSQWLTGYLNAKLQPLENCSLWDIWYMGQSPFPNEIVNPSIRASVISGLLQPHLFTESLQYRASRQTHASLRDLPDTSILFKRYLEGSKTINVYDWFESFRSVLDDQRLHYKDVAPPPTPVSPRKRGKGKGKTKVETIAQDMDDMQWEAHVQARFIRALHELDYLGFIKHGGSKVDHLVRTLFDIDDVQ